MKSLEREVEVYIAAKPRRPARRGDSPKRPLSSGLFRSRSQKHRALCMGDGDDFPSLVHNHMDPYQSRGAFPSGAGWVTWLDHLCCFRIQGTGITNRELVSFRITRGLD